MAETKEIKVVTSSSLEYFKQKQDVANNEKFATKSHTHNIGDVNELQSTLDSKAASGHTHDDRYYTESEIDTKLNAKANSSHTHSISNVSGLQSALDSKAASSHNHSASNITSGTLSVSRGGTGVTSDKAIALKSYPVGAVYISWSSTSPASLFGGTWSAITGRFPYFNAGTGTGGSNTHSLTVTEMPSHSHGISVNEYYGTKGTNAPVWSKSNVGGVGGWSNTYWTVGNGDGRAHNNMPAYQTLYAWRRTA